MAAAVGGASAGITAMAMDITGAVDMDTVAVGGEPGTAARRIGRSSQAFASRIVATDVFQEGSRLIGGLLFFPNKQKSPAVRRGFLLPRLHCPCATAACADQIVVHAG